MQARLTGPASIHLKESYPMSENPKNTIPQCSSCGSENVLFDAYVAWDETTQTYEIVNVFDKGHYCQDCDGECSIDWEESD